MKLQVIKNQLLYWLKSIVLYSLYAVVLLTICSFFILQLPAVQTRLAQGFLGRFSESTGFTGTIGTLEFFWFDRVLIQNLRVVDPEQNEMIGIGELQANFQFEDLWQSADINLDAVTLKDVRVMLKPIQETDSTRDLNINILVSRISKGTSSSSGTAGTFRIGEALIDKGTFTYLTSLDSIAKGFDYNHFQVQITEANLNQFVAVRDTVQFTVASLEATDTKTQFKVHNLRSFFRISQKAMEFKGLELAAGKSQISDTIVFSYQSQRDLNDFVNKVRIQAHLNKTIIHPEDLALFAPGTEVLGSPVQLSGTISGRVNQFRAQKLDLRKGSTHLRGDLQMDGLPYLDETFIITNLHKSRINLKDLDFLFSEKLQQRLAPLGTLAMEAQFLGYPSDFVANGTFQGTLGAIRSDINFKINETNPDLSTYKGKLVLDGFDLGQLLNDTLTYQTLSMDGEINGRGLTGSTADFKLQGKISELGILGYAYTGISTNARFTAQLFTGEVRCTDPNLKIQAAGTIDLRKQKNEIRLKANIDTADLHALKISPYPMGVRTQVDLDMTGFVLDSLQGTARLTETQLSYYDETIRLPHVQLKALRSDAERSLELTSGIVNAQATGNFYFSNLFTDVETLVKEFILNIKNDKAALASYYQTKKRITSTYEAEFALMLTDLQQVMDFLDLDVEVSKNTNVIGTYQSGLTTVIEAYTTVGYLRVQQNDFTDVDIELNASKVADSTEVLAMLYIHSNEQTLGNSIKTKNLTTEVIWDLDHMDVRFEAEQQNMANKIALEATVDFQDSTYIHVQNYSVFQVLENPWVIHPDNAIVIYGSEWSIRDFRFDQGNQSISLFGNISTDSSRVLTLSVQELLLENLNSLLTEQLKGKLNATVHLANAYDNFTIQNAVSVEQLQINNFLIGDITGNNLWNPEEKRFDLRFAIHRLSKPIVDCSGYYDITNRQNPLQVTAVFTKADLKIFEPFIDDLFSRFTGTLTGTYTLTGTLPKPIIQGLGTIDDGSLMINYLKTTYQFTGKFGFTPEAMIFRDMVLTDAFRNRGTLRGEIRHRNFAQMQVNIAAEFSDFQVLNTTANDNSLFYGQGYASGTVSITGPVNNIKISADAVTRKNTRIFIPISGYNSTEQKDFISFVSFSDSTYQAKKAEEPERKVNLTGVTIDFNLEVNPDAYCEIIFDLKAGDIIRGRGNGKIKLQLDTKGEFNMFGPVEFTEGWYNFTLYSLINKEFQIKPGGTITWYGDPYQGALNIDASYNQLASLAPILNDPTLSEVTQIKRKYPVEVLLSLDGPMLTPQISFDIQANDLPKSIPVDGRPPVALDLEFYAFKNKLDEQELKRQVFSLIILRRFSPLESGIDMSGSVANSVSELLSNQLSYWMSQVDDNLEIDVDLGTMDQETFNTFQLRLSYTFLNGRLRVTGDGTFNNQSSTTPTSSTGNQDELSSIAGDWTVDYLLTPDGKFKVKMYSRTNVNPLVNTINTQSTLTTGVSLMHTQSFNEVKDLLKASREKNRTPPPAQEGRNKEAVKDDEGSL